MSVADRANKRMKEDGGPMGAPPPPDGYYGQRGYPPYGGPPPGGPPMGNGYSMWQGGHPPPHSWGHGSSGPPPPMYQQRGGPPPPSMQDRGGYGGAYSRQPSAGGVRRGQKPPAGPPPSRKEGEGYQGNYYPPPQQYGQGHYGNGPPPMHHAPPPQSYGSSSSNNNSTNAPMYGNSPARPSQSRPRTSQEQSIGSSTTTGTDAPDFDNIFSPRAGADDDGNSSVATGGGGTSKDKGRGSYKCGRCGVPKKGHVCPYQPKVTRKIGEPLPEMRSAAIQVEMDEFMTLRRLNLKIQGFPESYASEPHGEDMVVGEPHHHTAMNAMSPRQQPQQEHGDMMTATDNNGPSPTMASSGHDPVASALSDDPLVGAA